MKIFTTKKELEEFITAQKKSQRVIGFVPTMGALHQGHISLINIAREKADIVVCSIFVNPTQFNDPNDLEKYPRPIEKDIQKLQISGCDILFLPAVSEMYGQNEDWSVNLGEIENLLEGKFRPRHYQGVTQIVKKLFDVVRPDIAFFGQKDFQQFLVIKTMVKLLGLPVELEMCPIVREADGLAMSSRNVHLSATERTEALALSRALQKVKEQFETKSLDELVEVGKSYLENSEGLKLEYFEICNADTLLPATSKDYPCLIALVAAFVGKTRLIDNLILK